MYHPKAPLFRLLWHLKQVTRKRQSQTFLTLRAVTRKRSSQTTRTLAVAKKQHINRLILKSDDHTVNGENNFANIIKKRGPKTTLTKSPVQMHKNGLTLSLLVYSTLSYAW